MYYEKYLKYKNKYLELKSIEQTGGSYDKTIILSCKEFDETVDKLIALDGKLGPVMLDGININELDDVGTHTPPLSRSKSDSDTVICEQLLSKIQSLDTLKEKIDITNIRFHQFLEDIAFIKIKDIIKELKKEGLEGKYTPEQILILTPELLVRTAISTKLTEDKLNEYLLKYMRNIHNYETKNFFRGFINWKTYPDSTPDIKMNKQTVSKLRGAKIIYFAYFSFNEPDVTPIIDQLLFLNSLSHYGVAEINIVLPFFPVGTMERIVGEGEIPTGYSLAHMLNSIPNGTAKNNIYIYDIHALCSRFFFHTNINPILITMMTRYTKYIEDNYKSDSNLNVIIFPDDGAKKRYEKLLKPEMKKILCNKTRVGDTRITRIEEGIDNLLEGNTIIDKNINLFLIDDLVQSGGTILEAFKGINKQLCEYKGYNIAKIKFIPIITHSIFPSRDSVDKFFNTVSIITNKTEPREVKSLTAKGCNVFSLEKLITTNSRPNKIKEIKRIYNHKIEVIDIADSFYDVYIKYTETALIGPYIVT